MSLVTLSTKTPTDFFTKHELVLHVAKSEMDKVRVFQAWRELSLAVISVFPSCPRMGTDSSHPLWRIIPEHLLCARFQELRIGQ